MNTYALLTWSDGTFLVRSEHATKEAGIIAYDNLHAALINDTVAECSIRLVDSQFNIVDNKYFDIIRHTAQPTPEPTEE